MYTLNDNGKTMCSMDDRLKKFAGNEERIDVRLRIKRKLYDFMHNPSANCFPTTKAMRIQLNSSY